MSKPNVIPPRELRRLSTAAERDAGLETVVALDDIDCTGRYRKDVGDLSSLIESINSNGLIHPVVITADRRLVAGGRRIAAFRELGRTHIQARVTEQFDDAVTLLEAERDENICRKEMVVSELVALGADLEVLERKRAKARQAEGLGQRHLDPASRFSSIDENQETPSHGITTTDVVGKVLGLTGSAYERARFIVKATQSEDEAVRITAERALNGLDAGTESLWGAGEKVRAAKRGEVPPPSIVTPAKKLVRRNGRSKPQLQQLISIKAVIDGYVDIVTRMTSEAEAQGFDASLQSGEAAQQVNGLIASVQALTRTLNTLRKESTQ